MTAGRRPVRKDSSSGNRRVIEVHPYPIAQPIYYAQPAKSLELKHARTWPQDSNSAFKKPSLSSTVNRTSRKRAASTVVHGSEHRSKRAASPSLHGQLEDEEHATKKARHTALPTPPSTPMKTIDASKTQSATSELFESSTTGSKLPASPPTSPATPAIKTHENDDKKISPAPCPASVSSASPQGSTNASPK